MKKAVIFDLDGLLIDSEKISYQVFQKLIEPYEGFLDIDTYVKKYTGHSYKQNLENLIKTYALPLSIEEADQIAQPIAEKLLQQGVPLKSGVKELLEYLKTNSYSIVLATSSNRTRAQELLSNHEILDYFEDAVYGPEIKRGKPYPDIFLKAAQKAEALPENCLILEDSEAGIQAGASAQIPVICIPDMKEPSQKYKDMTVTVLPSLINVIEYLEQEAIH